jgi:D-glycero-D-manno-heptose 1,7-bisphosphate phosphatase
MELTKAVFLDRDGVINELIYHQEAGVIDSPFTVDQMTLLPFAGQAIRLLNEAGLKVVVISNQPGVAKDNFSPETLQEINEKMRQELAEQGAVLDGLYCCLHHPDAKEATYAITCQCRKPKPGMVFQAAQELGISPDRSYMVGDNLTDIKAGQAAGCRTILLGKHKCETCHLMDQEGVRPDLIIENLLKAAQAILDWERETQSEPQGCPQTALR